MNEVPSFYQSTIDSIRRDYMYLNGTRYPEAIKSDSVFSTIARFTPLEKFDEGDYYLNHYKVWCNSVGIWVTVSVNGLPKYVLAVRQTHASNAVGLEVWEIPSGHTEPEIDRDAYVSATRELREETGIACNPAELMPLTVIRKKDPRKGALLFRASIDIVELRKVIGEPIGLEEQTQIFNPPRSVDSDEIDAIALIPTNLSLPGSDSPLPGLLENSRHGIVTHKGLSRLIVTKFNAGDLF